MEDYLNSFPDLLAAASLPISLICEEFRARQLASDSHAQIADYLNRFPHQAAELARELAHLTVPVVQEPVPQPPGDEPIPATIGRYKVECLLEQGAFGRVYRGFDDQLNRPVAIKIPYRRPGRPPPPVGLYQEEARKVAKLSHPHIVPVYDAGPFGESSFYVVSKLIDGTSLAQRLESRPPSIRQAAEWAAAICDALAYAHQKGIYHRDVKPGNILIDKEDRPHLVDFGLALRQEERGEGAGGVLGTPHYMSPEQAGGNADRVDGRTDIYSLGAVLYAMLTGGPPFTAASLDLLLKKIADLDLPATPPAALRPEIDPELDRICQKALAKKLEDRYQTAREMADDLRRFLARPANADRAIEAIIEAHAKDIRTAWQDLLRRIKNGEPDDTLGLTHYVEPHYAGLPKEYNPLYLTQHSARRGGEQPGHTQDMFKKIKTKRGKKPLARLLTPRRLCLMEDAGTGKSIFTRRAEAFLSSQEGWELIADGRPCLAVRCERSWPGDVLRGLEEKIRPWCPKVRARPPRPK